MSDDRQPVQARAQLPELVLHPFDVSAGRLGRPEYLLHLGFGHRDHAAEAWLAADAAYVEDRMRARVHRRVQHAGDLFDHVEMTLDLLPETVIERSGLWTLAVNRNRDLLGKSILVLHRSCTAVIDIEPAEWASLQDELRRFVPALDRLLRPDTFNFAFLMNQDPQVHLHVIPRYASPRRWHGHEFTDPHWGRAFGQEQRDLDRPALALLASEIRTDLQQGSTAT